MNMQKIDFYEGNFYHVVFATILIDLTLQEEQKNWLYE